MSWLLFPEWGGRRLCDWLYICYAGMKVIRKILHPLCWPCGKKGGIIPPMDGIGPGDLQIDSLVQRVANEEVKEIVLALSTTMEGDTTNFFIYRKLSPYNVKITVIARGVSIGDEIEYADEITLGRSIVNRTSFNDSIKI